MKHRHVTYATRHLPGYNKPTPPASKKGKGYPHRQAFKKPSSKG